MQENTALIVIIAYSHSETFALSFRCAKRGKIDIKVDHPAMSGKFDVLMGGVRERPIIMSIARSGG
jgi:hypothetical protein